MSIALSESLFQYFNLIWINYFNARSRVDRLSSERDMQNSRFFIFFRLENYMPIRIFGNYWIQKNDKNFFSDLTRFTLTLCSDDFENPIFQSYLRKLFRTGYDTFDTH